MKKYFACLLTFFIITFCAFSCLCQDIDKTEQLPTYSLTIGDKIISLQETKDGFLKDTEIDVLWEVVRQTPTHIIAFQPDGKLVKLEKTKPQLKSVNLNPDERMDIEYSSKEYTPESPYIVLNPYGFTPLTALMRFKTEKPSHVRITIKGRGRAPDLSFNHPENKTEHYLPILGLYANHTNKIDLTVYTETEKKTYPLTIKTEPFSFPLFYMPMQKKIIKIIFMIQSKV